MIHLEREEMQDAVASAFENKPPTGGFFIHASLVRFEASKVGRNE